jgi:hypothetical protein
MGMSERLSAIELVVWASTYAADFARAVNEANRLGAPDPCGVPHAEDACFVADAAVAQLRGWMRREGYCPGDDADADPTEYESEGEDR